MTLALDIIWLVTALVVLSVACYCQFWDDARRIWRRK
jgi:hypothetical protein